MNAADRSEADAVRFLLIIPVLPRRGGRLVVLGNEGLPNAFSSRLSSRAQVLRQEWRTLDPDEVGRLNGGETVVDRLASCRIGGTLCLASEVLDRVVEGTFVVELEERLTRVGKEIAHRFAPPDHTCPWVGRAALLDGGTLLPHSWLDDQPEVRRLMTRKGDEVVLRLGWGNSVVEHWSALSQEEQNQLVRGVVDAQSVWGDLDAISQAAVARLANVLKSDDRAVSRGEVRALQRASTDLRARMAVQNLAHDDTLLNTQGLRNGVANAYLEAWNYGAAAARVERQLEELSSLASQQADRLRRRYERTVEVVLLGLALLTIVDIVLSTVSTAFSEAAGQGPDGTLGVFEALRASGGEDVVGVAVAVTVLLAVMVLVRSRT